MADMAAEEYRQMVCVESVIAPQKPVVLQPGADHALTAEICTAP
jgi:D-hexose-6-phosphate mutarotase